MSAILLEKVFLAGCRKNFTGKESRQLSKFEIRKLDISKLAETVFNEFSDSRLSLSMTYVLGLCRIYEKAVIFLQEDVVKFHDELNSVFYNTDSAFSKSKKTKKKREAKEFDVESVMSDKLCEEFDLISLFSKNLKTDEHLLKELDIHMPNVDTLPEFGDEIHLQNGHLDELIREIRSGPAGLAPSELESISRENEDTEPSHPSTPRGTLNERRDVLEVTGTPKRKTCKPHDETPSKRQRKSPSRADFSAEKSATSRRLFHEDGPSSSRPNDEIIRRGVDQYGVEPFDEHMPPVKGVQEGPGQSSAQINNSVQDFEPDPQPDQLPADGAPSQNGQHLPDASLEDLDDMQLKELNDEELTALTPRRRRQVKQITVFDEENQIPKIDITNYKAFFKIHTKKSSTIANPENNSLRNLFSLPATRLKPTGPCTWGRKLQNLYLEMARPILHPSHEETRASSVPRDVNVVKRPRISSFRRNSTTVPSPSEDIGDNNVDPDRELMPPPYSDSRPILLRPSDEQPSPRTPSRSHLRPPSLPSSPHQQSPRQHLPSTPTGRHIQPGNSAVSPRQQISVPNIMIEEGSTAEESSTHAALPNVVEISPRSTASSRERSLLMKEYEFHTFLKDLFTRSNKIDLDNIIIPRRATLTAFYRYFNFLQRLQVERKLTMIQKIIYGPVYIVKGTEE